MKEAAALGQQYANCGYAPEALIAMLGKIACRDNFTEMRAFKHHQATYEEFHGTRPSLRWRHLVAAVQAAAIPHGEGRARAGIPPTHPGREHSRGRANGVPSRPAGYQPASVRPRSW